MQLRDSVPKISARGTHREVPVADTWARVYPYALNAGVTRMADITGLDRVGIPVYNAIVPRSFDVISVYNGKGASAMDAKTSALMEAVERFAATQPLRADAIASYVELRNSGESVLDPRTYNLELDPRYRLETPISWVRGYDLICRRSVLVPMYLAGYYMRFHETPCYPIATTNGIASGNSVEEAICHALCELIERDAWTLADIISNRLSRVVGRGALGASSGAASAWLEELSPNIDTATLPDRARAFVEMFEAAGLSVNLKNVRSPTGIATVMATVVEHISPTFSNGHAGLGTHPDPEVAATRAITEVAQSRVVDINAMREDITLPGTKVSKWFWHVQRNSRVNKEAWAYKRSRRTIPLGEIPSYPSDDVIADIDLMLSCLRAAGLEQAIVVDLSPPTIPAHVVRMIVPGLETWMVDRSKLGPRAAEAWRTALGLLERLCTPTPTPEKARI